ncbi:nitrate reductase [Sediminitomix flava]|uniref:nitrate reductase (cytochrome) n=1 Tax=Sediminitomix flava TaxID=379075 RepID=A0A315ZCP0_SEDFL|nr:nitrate reductase [Sediminitomix flava]PWJ42879.1 ferredoxin-nitrate reductase [Sediminitomix flava]
MNKTTSKFKSTCSYCGVGCGIEVQKSLKGEIKVTGDENYPVNKGMLCSKGMNLNYVVSDTKDRLLYPQMRWSKNHPLKRVDWDTAFTRATAVFRSIIQKFGPDSVGMYVSGQCLTEEYYIANKLTKGFFGTNNIDTNSRLCMSSAVVGYKKTIGDDAVPICYDDIELADTFFITGANPAWCHPILFRRIEKHKEENPNVKIIVVDPRKTQTCSSADLHLQLKPGTDAQLHFAIGRHLIETGNIAVDFIEKHVSGYEAYKEEVFKHSLSEYAEICGLPEGDIKLAAQWISESKGFLTMWTMGLNQSAKGTDKNLSLLALNLITGQIGKPGAGPFSLTGQPNAMGGREVGGMANLLAAHRDLMNPDHRAEVADFWGVDAISPNPGYTATRMFEALERGDMKAIWIVCTNPMVSLPDSNLVEKALKKARFVIVQDISGRSDTLQFADLVLPAAGWLEKEGTMTNSERRISYLPKVVDAPGEALPDLEIFLRFARKMGYHGFNQKNAEEVFIEYTQMTKGTKIDIDGLDYQTIQKHRSIQWPYLKDKDKGTERLFTDFKFYTEDSKAHLHTSINTNDSDALTSEYPLVLTTGRIRDHWHTMTRTGKVNRLNTHIEKPYLEIHPADADARNISEGDIVQISNGRGNVRVEAQITDKIREGVVFLPMHWGKILEHSYARTNNLTSRILDPISGEPDFKYAAVQVEKYKQEKQRIIIVGAGAASHRFLMTYRSLNQEDEILVFSKEQIPFYDRVLLPEYVNESLDFESLLKFRKGEFEALNASIYVNTTIDHIDRKNKEITDNRGQTYTYDRLIIATGSRAFLPPGTPVHLPCVFTMRNKSHADALKTYINGQGHVVIVGGGLLGLELASALREMDVDVSIVQLASRLMERQLDPMASSLLLEHVEDLGIQVYTNDQVQEVNYDSENNSAYAELKSGKLLNCDAVVYAIGTRPNVELGKEAGLTTSRGLVVNAYLQTSDPDIFAVGEVAEFEQKLNGTTAAAEEMSDIMSRFIAGDRLTLYKGTVPMNILKFSTFDLCSLGMVDVPSKAKGYDEIILLDKAKRYYKKCIVYKDRLVGAVLMGDKAEFAEYKNLIANQTELSEKREELLRGSSDKQQVLGEVVCSCGNVGKGNIEQHIQSGCTDYKKLCEQTGAGLGCGSCKPEVKDILDQYLIEAQASV